VPKTKIDPIEHAKARLEKLKLYNYLVHKAVYGGPGDYTEAGRRHYDRVNERTQALTKRILSKLDGVCDTTVTWCPERHDTYEVAKIVKEGADGVEEYMSVPLEVAGWGPLAVRRDCEGGQGWIYCPANLAWEVARRIKVLDGSETETYSYTELHGEPLPPADLDVCMGCDLARLVKKGEHPAPAMRLPGEALPARKISDGDALNQIAKLVLNVSYDMEEMCHQLEEIVLKTGRTS